MSDSLQQQQENDRSQLLADEGSINTRPGEVDGATIEEEVRAKIQWHDSLNQLSDGLLC